MTGAIVHVRLAALETRRAFSLATVVAFALYLLALASASWSSAVGSALVDEHELSSRALAREAILSGGLLFLAPWMLLHAGGTLARWRAREAGWLGSRPTSRPALVASAWLGTVAASICGLALVVAAVLARTGWGEPSWRYLGGHSLEEARTLEPGASARFALAEPSTRAPSDSRLRVHLARTLGHGAEHGTGPAEAELVLSRQGVEGPPLVTQVSTRSRIELDIPSGEGALELRVTDRGSSSLAVLPDRSFEFWTRGGREGWATMELAARALLAIAAACALALGLGAWMSAASASALVLSLWLGATTLGGARAWIPGARILRDLEFVRAGRLPEAMDARWLAGAAVVVLAGGILAVIGLRSWSTAS